MLVTLPLTTASLGTGPLWRGDAYDVDEWFERRGWRIRLRAPGGFVRFLWAFRNSQHRRVPASRAYGAPVTATHAIVKLGRRCTFEVKRYLRWRMGLSTDRTSDR